MRVASRGTVAVPAPKLLLRADEKATAAEVPLADLVWRLHLPSGYDVVGTGGTVATDELKPPPPAAVQVAQFLFGWNDNLSRYSLLPSVQCAREAARRAPDRGEPPAGAAAYQPGLHNYAQASKAFPPSAATDSDAATGAAGRSRREITQQRVGRPRAE